MQKSRRNKNKDNTIGIPLVVLVMVAAAVIFGSIFGDNVADAKTSSDFVRKAMMGNEFEIQSSQIALEKSQNDQIRQFAQRMIEDHAKAGQDLNAILASSPDADADIQLDRKHQTLLADLNKASEGDFDKKYVKDQVKAHNEAVDLFKSYAKDGDNQALKDFANRTLPTIQAHQHDIRQMNSSL